MPDHFVSASCGGETCAVCRAPATHKLGECIMHDDPQPFRHELTAYVCCAHWRQVLGPAVSCPVLAPVATGAPQPTQGWVRVSDWKWHYLAPRLAHANEWRSLCGRYGTLVKPDFDPTEGLDDSPDNCRACVAKLSIRRTTANVKQEVT